MYVFVRVCVKMCVGVSVCAWVRGKCFCVRVCESVSAWVCVYVCICVRVYKYECMYFCTCVSICVCGRMCEYMCVCVWVKGERV